MNTAILLTDEEYARLNTQHELFHSWLGSRSSWKEEEVPEGKESIDNTALSLMEVYRFLKNKPKKYFAYVNREKGIVTTWMGDVLGTATFGYPYEVPAFGGWKSKRQSLTVKAINGLTYHGTYYLSSGDYCRLTANKNQ